MPFLSKKEDLTGTLIGKVKKIPGPAKAPFIIFLAVLANLVSLGQSTYFNLNEDIYHQIDRYETQSASLSPFFFSVTRPFKRDGVVSYMHYADSAGWLKSSSDKFNFNYLNTEAREFSNNVYSESKKPLLKNFYRFKSDFYAVREKDFDLHLNPVIYTGFGKDNLQSDPLYTNTRGFELRSTIDQKIGLYTFLSENQVRLPFYVQQDLNPYRVIPHESLWKRFKTNGADFILARAYLSFRATRHIDVQFGHDRTFIGNGYRSLILSDWAPPSLFLRTNLKIWKINYLFQLNRLNADILTSPAGTLIKGRYPQKFFAFHQASINLTKRLNISLFESVIFSPEIAGNTDYFDLGYLNPVIFYRSVEQQFGSPDNIILGVDFKWLVTKGLSVYGQLVLDEFVLSKLLAGDGWWGNKFAIQGGVKMTDLFGVQNLDLQLEGNVARPYTYSQSGQYLSYSHYRQPLAHPLGANFAEGIGILRFQPVPGLFLTAKGIIYKTGKDGEQENWGGDILKENDINRAGNSGNVIGQGQETTVTFADLSASWMLRHNLFIDLRQTIRKSNSTLLKFDNTNNLTSIAIRLNIAPRTYEY